MSIQKKRNELQQSQNYLKQKTRCIKRISGLFL